jgi:lysylphosphatidylglycerol synthetase-like protein (DUF2156 family)
MHQARPAAAGHPLLAGGRLLGYCPALERRLPSAHSGVQKLLLLHVLEQLKREGAQLLNLGFSPLWDLRAGLALGMRPAWWVLLGGAWMYEHCNDLYGFKALAAGRWAAAGRAAGAAPPGRGGRPLLAALLGPRRRGAIR